MTNSFARCVTRMSLVVTTLLLTLAVAQAKPASLTGPRGTLTLGKRGVVLKPRGVACPAIVGHEGQLWSLILQQVATPPARGKQIMIEAKGQKSRLETTADGFRLVYDGLTDGKQTWKVGLTLVFTRQGDAFQIAGELRNDESGWLVSTFTGPALGGIKADLTQSPLLFPKGMGQRFTSLTAPIPTRGGKQKAKSIPAGLTSVSFTYPSGSGTMQWCAFAGEKGGLYLGCHDAAHGAKSFNVQLNPQNGQYKLAIQHHPFCPPGGRWMLPPLVIRPYAGFWHVAAHDYRAWYDSVEPPRQVPDWTKGASGWLLCILKQQNGEIMWDYPSLSKLCDIADARGLDILGLFGWPEGGHDHLYPEYIPDPKMGGPEALRKVLAEVRKRGKYSIIYANGQLIARNTEYWRTRGKNESVINEDGTHLLEKWQKYRSFPAQEFDIGCHYSKGWEETLLALAMQAHDLGADGILYDQQGVVGPRVCYATNHGHPSPASVYAEDRRGILRRIADRMKAVDPNFIIMTEGLNDAVLDSISYYHGCVPGVFTTSQAEVLSRTKDGGNTLFPELFRYTFPEIMTTIRHATPMMDRLMANYACAYGLRYEIETRYAPDVRYLKENVVPASEDYRDILGPPSLEMMRATPPEEATRYLKQVIDLQRANADLLWRGRFVDNEGFKFEGKEMIAKGFKAGNRLGVLVWNPASQPATFKLEVPGARLVQAAEPGKDGVDPLGPLAAQSIRLVTWEK